MVATPKSVFISYSSKDEEAALRLAESLRGQGIHVIIDEEKMRAGEKIEAFIEESIQTADATILLVSKNSLLSSWVAKETLTAFQHCKLEPGKQFLSCYLDEDFLDRDFRVKATKYIDGQIEEIDQLFADYKEQKVGFKDLTPERERLTDLRHDLGDILRELKGSKVIDLRENEFERNLTKVVEALEEKHEGLAAPAVAGDLPSEVVKPGLATWFEKYSGLLFIGAIALFVAGIFLWTKFYVTPKRERIENAVTESSHEFLRAMGQQEAGGIQELAQRPFFFGDEQFRDSEQAALTEFFGKLFEYARSGSEEGSDNIQVRLAAVLSRYLAKETKRSDFDVFEVVRIEKIVSDLESEKEEDRGDIPEPRVKLGEDGARASVYLPGFKDIEVIYVYFSIQGKTARIRGVLFKARE